MVGGSSAFHLGRAKPRERHAELDLQLLQSLRIIVYARKAKEVREREEREAHVHWGEDLQEAEDEKRKADS